MPTGSLSRLQSSERQLQQKPPISWRGDRVMARGCQRVTALRDVPVSEVPLSHTAPAEGGGTLRPPL